MDNDGHRDDSYSPYGRDLEKMLDLAERLQGQRNRSSAQVALLRSFQIILAGVIFVFAYVWGEALLDRESLLITCLVVFVCGFIPTQIFILRHTATKRRYSLALQHLVELVRETEHSEMESCPPLERAHLRVRLSLFDIGGTFKRRSYSSRGSTPFYVRPVVDSVNVLARLVRNLFG